MDPIIYNHSVLKLIGISSVEEDESVYIKIGIQLFHALLVVMHILVMLASATYFFKFVSEDFSSALYAFLAATILSCNIYILIILRMNSHKMNEIFLSFKAIHREYRNSKAFHTNSYAHRLGVKVTTFFVKFYSPFYILLLLCFVPSMEVVQCYLRDHLTDRNCLHIPYRYVLPWDQATFAGYYPTIMFAAFFSGAYFVTNAIIIAAFVVICLQFHSMRVHYEYLISTLKDLRKSAADYNVQIRKTLIAAIRFQILMRDLFSCTEETFSGCIFVQLLGNINFMATSLFQMDTAVRNMNFYIFVVINVVFTSSTNLFLYCYAGAIVTENALKYADALFETDWYKMPNDLQKYFILMISEAQRPIYLDGYGLVRLSLEGFTKMLKTVMSYYLMFRTLAVK